MPETLEFDPSEGFVALPVRILEIEMSPGAFRTLTELCRMANLDGFCWPSLEQLSARLSRSRSAISGYVKELREIGLIDTINQKMANGYNYRLKFLVTFWAAWRASLSATRPREQRPEGVRSVPPPERRVQSGARRVNSKNHIPENHPRAPGLDAHVVEGILEKWAVLTRGQPYGSYAEKVPASLVQETTDILASAGPDEPALISADITRRLTEIWSTLGVSPSSSELSEQANLLSAGDRTETAMAALASRIADGWQRHWRKPPTPLQFEGFVKAARAENPVRARLTLLKMHLRQWTHVQNRLPKPALSNSLAPRGTLAFDNRATASPSSYPRI